MTRNRDTLKSFEAGALEDVTTHHLVELESREMAIPDTLITARAAIGSRLQYLQHMFGLQEAETAASARGNNGVVTVGDVVVVSVTGGSNPPRTTKPHCRTLCPPSRSKFEGSFTSAQVTGSFVVGELQMLFHHGGTSYAIVNVWTRVARSPDGRLQDNGHLTKFGSDFSIPHAFFRGDFAGSYGKPCT